MHQLFHIFTSFFAGSIYLLCETEKENTDKPLLQQSATGNKPPNSSKRQCPGISCNALKIITGERPSLCSPPPWMCRSIAYLRDPSRVKFWILTNKMALKLWHKTTWNGHKQHKDESNTYKDMPFSSKCETTILKIQTRDICSLC